VQATLLVRHAPASVADGFIASRIAGEAFAGAAFGTLATNIDCRAIVARASPEE
jgi:putative acyl-CoA dehydrogenase